MNTSDNPMFDTRYSYGEHEFAVAMLVIGGLRDTFLVADLVGFDNPGNELSYHDILSLLPDGTYDGEKSHEAVIVTFNPYRDYATHLYIQVPRADAFKVLHTGASIWKKLS